MGVPTARSDDDKLQQRFSGVRSGFLERMDLAVPVRSRIIQLKPCATLPAPAQKVAREGNRQGAADSPTR
jgi:hypothetical protein